MIVGVSLPLSAVRVAGDDWNCCRVRDSGMLRTRNLQPSLWESVLPEVCLRLPAELERVDGWLDDEVFFRPVRAHFDIGWGSRRFRRPGAAPRPL